MNILFLHRSFPAQFRHIALELAKDPLNLVMFITTDETMQVRGINKLIYKPQREVPADCHPYLKVYEESIIHGQAVADLLFAMKNKGIKPDIIFGHTWGTTLFVKEIFPDVPLLCYFEWFGRTEGADMGFDGRSLNDNQKANVRCNQTHLLLDLCNCDAGISPTYWQRDQFPKEFHDKIKVLHDGVNTELCKPDENATFTIKDKNLVLTSKDEVITYATRGMEPYRGFPEFMKAVEKLLIKRPNAHFIVGGEDKVYYGPGLEKGTFKELMLKHLRIDLKRVHFVGALPFNDYVNLLQISSVHVYPTYPFVLSWSLLDAMAVGCCVVASSTKPVLEVIKDNYNGLLYDFYDIKQLVEKVVFALENKDKMKEIRENAIKTITENYALKDILPQQLEYIKSLIKK